MEAAGSGSCRWKAAGDRRLPLWAALWRAGIVLSQDFCRALHFRQEGGFMNKSCCVPAVPADKAVNAVPASGACSRLCEIQWGYCHKCHGIMCEGLSSQGVLCLQQVHGGAGGQLSFADSFRETHSVPSFLNISLNVLSWHHFPIWELGGLSACCCLVAVKGLSPTVKCHQLADGQGSHKCLQYVLLTEPAPMCQSRAG